MVQAADIRPDDSEETVSAQIVSFTIKFANSVLMWVSFIANSPHWSYDKGKYLKMTKHYKINVTAINILASLQPAAISAFKKWIYLFQTT